MVRSHVLYPLSYESKAMCEGLEPPCRNERRWISNPEHLPILPTHRKTVDIGIEPMSPESESDVLPLHQSTIIRMERFELSTFGLSDRHSNRLSYIRKVTVGFEPTITVLQTVVLTT